VLNALSGDDFEGVARMVGVDPADLHSGNFDVNVDPADQQAGEDINATRVEEWEKASIKKPNTAIKAEQATRRKKLIADVNDIKAKVKREVKRRKALAEQIATLEAQLHQFEDKSVKQGKVRESVFDSSLE
jgi:seryl-tRNA synthetase